jgi:hypothetical protein
MPPIFFGLFGRLLRGRPRGDWALLALLSATAAALLFCERFWNLLPS